MTKRTLSFGILNDLAFQYGPIHVDIDNDVKSVSAAVTKLVEDLKMSDPSGYFYSCYLQPEYRGDPDVYVPKETIADVTRSQLIADVIAGLMQNNHFVANQYNKYYVIAFALDHTTFPIFSKDHEYGQQIMWTPSDKNRQDQC
jgi:hypothetical protein